MGSVQTAILTALALTASGWASEIAATIQDPFTSPAAARVLLFVRSDCPLTARYAPELRRIAAGFATRKVSFWLVYADPAETEISIRKHMEEYRFPGAAVRDPRHLLARRAQAKVAPEAAVFDSAGKLAYVGRIDDRYINFGKERATPRTHELESAISAVLSGRPVVPSRTRAVGCFLADVE